MKKKVFGLLPAVFLFCFGLSGCQSCNCGEEAADEQVSSGPHREETRPPGPESQRVSLEDYSKTAELDPGGEPEKRKSQAVDLSGMPMVEPVKMDGKTKAPPATIRITSVLKRVQEEMERKKGTQSTEPVLAKLPPDDSQLPPSGRRKKGKLVRKQPKGAKNAPPQRKPGRGTKAGTPR